MFIFLNIHEVKLNPCKYCAMRIFNNSFCCKILCDTIEKYGYENYIQGEKLNIIIYNK